MDVEKLSVDGFNLNVSDAKARDMISDKYDPDNGTYVVGDTCINDDILYICNTDIDTPEDFDSSKWDADTVGHYCSELKSNLTDSGWQVIADYYQYRKLNGVVYVRKKDTTQVSITASFTTLFTLPEGFRPTNSNGSFVYSVPAMAQAQGIQIKVLDTGDVQAAAQFGSNTPVMYQWAISFPLG